MPQDESSILVRAQIIMDAVALSQSMLDGDVQEARFRARLIATRAPAAGLPLVSSAAVRVIHLLGTGAGKPSAGYAEAIDALSLQIDQADLLLVKRGATGASPIA